jgi:oligopeptide/dipeptide ABC transporter ATP-binding protein
VRDKPPTETQATGAPEAAAAGALLEVCDLHTHFRLPDGRAARAVDGISFTVRPGETVALVGESGCGKSATAFSIMRLLPASAHHPRGRILLAGKELLTAPEPELERLRGNRLAMVFQEPMTSLNPVMRVGQQLMEPLRLHRGLARREAEREAVALLRHVGIPSPEARLRDHPHQLSGGMKQRVMIAMALACRPALLIADEPTTALDVTIQAQILRLMKELQAETGMALLFITHDLGIVRQVADRVCVMYAGQIVEQGPVDDLFRALAHPYTRALFDALPRGQARQQPLRTIPGTVPAATAWPDGCRFHDRCPYRFERCAREASAAHPVGAAAASAAGHTAACHWREAG